MLVIDCGLERIPIVFLSGVVDLDDIAARVGTAYYLAKPFSLQALRAVLSKALGEHRAPTYPDGELARHAAP